MASIDVKFEEKLMTLFLFTVSNILKSMKDFLIEIQKSPIFINKLAKTDQKVETVVSDITQPPSATTATTTSQAKRTFNVTLNSLIITPAPETILRVLNICAKINQSNNDVSILGDIDVIRMSRNEVIFFESNTKFLKFSMYMNNSAREIDVNLGRLAYTHNHKEINELISYVAKLKNEINESYGQLQEQIENVSVNVVVENEEDNEKQVINEKEIIKEDAKLVKEGMVILCLIQE